MGMRLAEKHAKYLGAPAIAGHSKKEVFKDRMWKKLKGWTEIFLSRTRKEVLLKSVIHAMPTYLMNIFKLLGNIIEEMHRWCARFLWASANGKRKTHWKV